MFNFKAIFATAILLYCVFEVRAIDAAAKEYNKTFSGVENKLSISSRAAALQIKDLPELDLRYHTLPPKCQKSYLPIDCAEATSCTKRSGVYNLQTLNTPAFYAPCDVDTEGGDWIVIQRRQDGTENFYRNWAEYENGFGNLNGEFFIGLKKLYALTNFNGPQELLIIMESRDLVLSYARYSVFSIGAANELYKIKQLGDFSGNTRDSLRAHLNNPFSTKDNGNGPNMPYNCAPMFLGGYWYTNCAVSNLNGQYGDKPDDVYGLFWNGSPGTPYRLKYVKMMIRRRKY